MNPKIAYAIGFLTSVGFVGLLTLGPKWFGTLVLAVAIIALMTWAIGEILASMPSKEDSDDRSA